MGRTSQVGSCRARSECRFAWRWMRRVSFCLWQKVTRSRRVVVYAIGSGAVSLRCWPADIRKRVGVSKRQIRRVCAATPTVFPRNWHQRNAEFRVLGSRQYSSDLGVSVCGGFSELRSIRSFQSTHRPALWQSAGHPTVPIVSDRRCAGWALPSILVTASCTSATVLTQQNQRLLDLHDGDYQQRLPRADGSTVAGGWFTLPARRQREWTRAVGG